MHKYNAALELAFLLMYSFICKSYSDVGSAGATTTDRPSLAMVGLESMAAGAHLWVMHLSATEHMCTDKGGYSSGQLGSEAESRGVRHVTDVDWS